MSEPTTPPVDHSVKVTHLVFGLLFLGIAGVWALVTGEVDHRRPDSPTSDPVC